MKAFLFALAACLQVAPILRSQDFSSDDYSTSPGLARILGPVPDGTPSPTEVQKADYVVSPGDIVQTVERQQGGRTVTLRQIQPISLPPPPAPPAASKPDPEYTAHLADFRQDHPSSGLLILSATVYRSADSPPRTLVHYWPEKGGETITFWSSANFALIAGGIQSFIDSGGEIHSLIIGWGYVDLDRKTDLASSENRSTVPEVPTFPDGRATFQFDGKSPAAADLTAIQSLHDLYNSEHQRLLTAYQGREKARLQQEAELKANPPRLKNITLNYWRTEKPNATVKGATK